MPDGDSHRALSPAAAMAEVGRNVEATRNGHDLSYFTEHRDRFERTLERVSAIRPPPAKVLDIGSHYLHVASGLRLLGYDAHGMDVVEFAGDALAAARAEKFGVTNHAVERIDRGDFLAGAENAFDAVVFTEILEHITFNPVLFWRRLYEIVKPGGLIYITTPNALTPWKILSIMKNVLTLRGVGLSPSSILHAVTYGHHWKEYSGPEVRAYFAMMSPDFSVEVNYYNQDRRNRPPQPPSFKRFVRESVHRGAHAIPRLRDEMEIIVRIDAKTRWAFEPPTFV